MDNHHVLKKGADLASRLLDYALLILFCLAGLLLAFIVLSIGYVILARLLNLPALIWAVQFNEYALLWITFLGTAWVLKTGNHVSIDILTRFLDQKKMNIMKCLHSLLGIFLCATLSWFATNTVIDQFQRGTFDVKALDVYFYLPILIIPVGFIFLLLQFLRNFFHAVSNFNNE